MKSHSSKIFLLLSLVSLAVLLYAGFSAEPESPGLAGNSAPDFRVPSVPGGSEISLSDFRGKVVLLNFWASWCVPCLQEMPSLEALYRKYKSDGLEVVAVSIDDAEDVGEIKKVVDKYNLSFTILHDTESVVFTDYGVVGVPETFLIDKQGNYLEIYDSLKKQQVVRVVADRDWMSESFESEIAKLIR